MGSASAVRLQSIGKEYDGVSILKDISWAVPVGHIVGLLGLNGAGKTTLLRLLMGIVRPSEGSGWIGDHDIVADSPAMRQRVGYIAERSTIPASFTANRLERIGRSVFSSWDSGEFDRVLKRFSVPRDKRVYLMSQGQRVLVALAFALAHQAELLLLDEPTNGLDPLVRREFLIQLIEGAYDNGRTVIMSSHRIEEIRDVAQDVAILHKGRLVTVGSLETLLEEDHLVTLRHHEEVLDLARLPGAHRIVCSEQQATVYVRGFDETKVRAWLEYRRIVDWTHYPVSLEQLFEDRVADHVE